MGKIAIELSQRLDSRKYQILYKMHPREYPNWKMKYPKEFNSMDIKVLTNLDLYELLNENGCSYRVDSTSVMESLAFNKKSDLVESYGVHLLGPFSENGARSFFAKDAEGIIQIINQNKAFF